MATRAAWGLQGLGEEPGQNVRLIEIHTLGNEKPQPTSLLFGDWAAHAWEEENSTSHFLETEVNQKLLS